MDQQKPKAGHHLHHAQQQSADFDLPTIPDGDAIPPGFHHTEPQRSSPWQRFKGWVGEHKKASIIIAVLVVLLLAGGGAGLYFALKPKDQVAKHNTPAAATPKPNEPAKPKFYSPLTGREVANQDETHRSVTAVMIENSEWARPQSGLDDAGVVFEAIAEGGITRFAALYQDTKPKLIGPVRSVRPYYIDWLAAFDPTIVHIGGSANALKEVRSGAYKDADEFFNAQYFWRTTDRFAPHNVYTSFDKLDQLNADKGYVSSTFTGWPRKEDNPPITPNASKININISSAYFNVKYDFDKGCNCYDRYVGGEKQLDRESGQNAKPKVVIAMKVPTEIGFEDGYREQMTTIGTGTAYVFQDGTVSVGTWTKTGKKDQIVFKNDHGEVINLNRGQTWVSVTAPEQSVTWQ
jgi:hypothetical protein